MSRREREDRKDEEGEAAKERRGEERVKLARQATDRRELSAGMNRLNHEKINNGLCQRIRRGSVE